MECIVFCAHIYLVDTIMAVDDDAQWAIFALFTILALVGVGLWLKYLPNYRRYRKRVAKLGEINAEYNELCKQRKDLVFHFYWCVDRGDLSEANQHEKRVNEIDVQLGILRESYNQQKQQTRT